MPDSNGNFKGIAVSADAWLRVFGADAERSENAGVPPTTEQADSRNGDDDA